MRRNGYACWCDAENDESLFFRLCDTVGSPRVSRNSQYVFPLRSRPVEKSVSVCARASAFSLRAKLTNEKPLPPW